MIKIVLIYLLFINFIGFCIMLIDKNRAIHKEWRVPEKTLIGISIIGGSIGMILGMFTFRHKTKHLKFLLGIPVIIIIQFYIVIYLCNYVRL
ncbi:MULTISPECIES: DUF1294 domain-containing protein [unclassified Clostridium]|uniref:DUF1294 domain-containing protein n=1 Tax=unclassified Clostridium TaxID=2614128 RepID=UPI0013FBAD59|nr:MULTISPECIES: DUF1294 domain-containing protein [unclassified Clostridium]MBN1046347.1 DUF1294 domain-containing protein [Clostridium botulinum]NFN93776.1 DUF1294 domain-containing protein [Clostridium botulinum]NFR87656.1 DUF1294 domain-containing protein [Clostridium botulinum]NFR91716.1 DUF1294 domain-containing protein [Clostridium botulinum]NFS98058.1 DUF1294 domain-containing protein [Clostridium botulinum]